MLAALLCGGMPLGAGKSGKVRDYKSGWTRGNGNLIITQELKVKFRVLFFSKSFSIVAKFIAKEVGLAQDKTDKFVSSYAAEREAAVHVLALGPDLGATEVVAQPAQVLQRAGPEGQRVARDVG